MKKNDLWLIAHALFWQIENAEDISRQKKIYDVSLTLIPFFNYYEALGNPDLGFELSELSLFYQEKVGVFVLEPWRQDIIHLFLTASVAVDHPPDWLALQETIVRVSKKLRYRKWREALSNLAALCPKPNRKSNGR